MKPVKISYRNREPTVFILRNPTQNPSILFRTSLEGQICESTRKTYLNGIERALKVIKKDMMKHSIYRLNQDIDYILESGYLGNRQYQLIKKGLSYVELDKSSEYSRTINFTSDIFVYDNKIISTNNISFALKSQSYYELAVELIKKYHKIGFGINLKSQKEFNIALEHNRDIFITSLLKSSPQAIDTNKPLIYLHSKTSKPQKETDNSDNSDNHPNKKNKPKFRRIK